MDLPASTGIVPDSKKTAIFAVLSRGPGSGVVGLGERYLASRFPACSTQQHPTHKVVWE